MRRRSQPARFSALLALTVLTATALTSSAAARTQVFRDADDQADGTVLDITRVKVVHQRKVVVRVRHHGAPLTATTQIWFYFDTDPDDPGPEYRSRLVPNSDAFRFQRVDQWRGRAEDLVCRSVSGAADMFSDGPLVMRVGARCVGRPDEVGVAVRVRERADGQTFTDWAPARRTTFDPVRRH